MKGIGKWRQVTRGVIDPETRAARQAKMTAAAAVTAAALVAVRATILAQKLEKKALQEGHDRKVVPDGQAAPEGG